MIKKILFLLVVFVVIGIPTYAINVNEIDTKCVRNYDIGKIDCYTILEFPTNASLDPKFNDFKTEPLGKLEIKNKPSSTDIAKDVFHETVWDKNTVLIRGSFPFGNYLYWGIKDLWNSTWWNDTFPYRIPINVSVSSGETETDHQFVINVTYNANMSYTNFADLVFTNQTDNGLLDFWVEDNISSGWAYIWIESDFIINTTNKTFYMYFGNDDQDVSIQNIQDTMIFGDDFEDSSINTTIWDCDADESYSRLWLNGSAKYCYGKTFYNASLYWLEIEFDSGTDETSQGWTNYSEYGSVGWFPANHFATQVQCDGGKWWTNTRDPAGSTQTDRGGCTPNTNYEMNYRYTYESTAWYYRNGTNVWNHTTNLPPDNMKVFVDGRNTGLSTSVLHIFVRKFFNDTPVVFFGPQEESPTNVTNITADYTEFLSFFCLNTTWRVRNITYWNGTDYLTNLSYIDCPNDCDTILQDCKPPQYIQDFYLILFISVLFIIIWLLFLRNRKRGRR